MQPITIEYALEKARQQRRRYATHITAKSTPLETLASVDWEQFTQTKHDQSDLIAMNLELDPHGCLGRVALCLELCAVHHDTISCVYGEILDNWFRNDLLGEITSAVNALNYLADYRPTAQTFYILEEVSDYRHPRIDSLYGDKLWRLLKKRLDLEVARKNEDCAHINCVP